MLQDIMQDSFIMKLSQATRMLNFAIMVYAVENDITVSINKGEISETAMPDNLLPYINNDKEYCSYFSHGESLVVMYFLRFTIDEHSYIIIVQDNKKRTRLNKFVSMLMDALNKPPRMSSGAALEFAEQEGIISFMEMRIKELESSIKNKSKELNDKDAQLEALSNDIIKLNAAIEQNEQDAVLDMTILSQEKKELESKIEEYQALLQQRDAQVKKLDESEVVELWDEAAKEEVGELRATIAQLTAEHNEMQNELSAVRKQSAALQEDIDSLEADIRVHKDISRSKDEEIQSLKLDLRLLQNQQELVKIDDSDIDKELVAAIERAATLEAENASLLMAIEQVKEERISREESNELIKRIARLELDKSSLQERLEQSDSTIEELKNSIIDKSGSSISMAEHESIVNSMKASYEILQKQFAETTARLEENERSHVSNEEYNKALEEVERWKKVRAKLVKEQDDLRDELESVRTEKVELAESYKAMYEEMEHRSREVVSKEKLLADLRQSMKEQLKQQNEVKKHADSLAELNEILKKNRDKLTELINGLSQPILTVNDEYKVMLGNKALVVFTGSDNSVDLVNTVCHQTVYGQKEPCAWCMLERVKMTGEPMQVNVVMNKGETGERHLDVTFFPIFDSGGKLVEVGEFILDKTEVVELNASVSKFKEKMRDFKKSRMDDMNELNEVKRAYQDLNSEHDKVVERNTKMLKVIERLVSEDKARELLTVRTELMDVRNKLYRSSEMIKNYKYQLDEQLLKYSNLNKRTFLQMERLLNIMKTKNQLRSEETMSILTFLTREFELVKRHFIENAKKSPAKPITGGGGQAKELEAQAEQSAQKVEVIESGGKEFQSEEERMLYDKLAAAAQKMMNSEK